MSGGFPKAVAAGWHPIAAVRQLGKRPLARRLMGKPVVVFASEARPAVFLDRCPHRNMPLSAGRLRGGAIECPYHGWRFAGDGRCILTPGALQAAEIYAQTLPCVVAEGLVWTSLAADPAPFPALPHPLGDAGFDAFWWPVRPTRGALVDAIENLLDPAHPHFLHEGLVRSDAARRPVQVTVRTGPALAEAVYDEHARASALMPRLLEGQRTISIGRFLPPTIGQIAFEGPKGLRLAITVFFTPESRDAVRPFAHFATPRGRAPAWLKRALLQAFHVPVLAQDRAAVRAQFDNIEAFGAPRYAAGPLDFLRPAIQALAEGEVLEAKETKVEVRL